MKLIVKDLHKSFKENEVLKGCNYEFESNKITAILGVNGAGKTTFFKILNSALEYENGELLIEENNEIRPIKIDDVGMVSANNHLPNYLTGYEFVKFYIESSNIKDALSIDAYFDMVLFKNEDRHKLIKYYSDGMKSKLSIICILVQKPKVILLDEPLTAIDVVSSFEIKKILLKLQANRVVLLSTHILQLAKDMCDEIVILKDGYMKALEIKNDFENEIIHELKEDSYV